MRGAPAIALLATATAVAGCGSATNEPTAARSSNHQLARVFTVPEQLPGRVGAAGGPVGAHDRSRRRREAHRTPTAPAPTTAPTTAPTDAEIQRELAHALGVKGNTDVVDQAGLTVAGLATVPPAAPPKVAAIITAGNQVARAPYRYGGGHGGVKGDETWVDSAYDCSGSVSFALASARLVDRQLDSTSFESWGKPGPGKWVTVYANAGHAFMVVAGLRFDTVERSRTGTRWGTAPSRVSGFTARHPAGL